MREFFRLLVFIIAAALPAFLLRLPIADRLASKPVVLFVGDFRPNAFGSLVKSGVDSAMAKWDYGELPFSIEYLAFSEVGVPDGTGGVTTYARYEEVRRRFRRELLSYMATRNVVAVISANTSNSADVVLDATSVLHVPTLLTVATNDHLLENRTTAVFRLVPKDSLRAASIAYWSFLTLRQKDLLGVVYEPGQYGVSLFSAIRTKVGSRRVLGFAFGAATDATEILNAAKDLRVDSWVVAGYEHQALEFYSKKRTLGASGLVLMGDGSYGSWLTDFTNDVDLFMSFPSSQEPNDDLLRRMPGFSCFGHDAIQVLAHALNKPSTRMSRRELPEAIMTVSSELSDRGTLCHQYNFESGENLKGEFRIRPVNTLFVPDPTMTPSTEVR